MPFKNQNHSLTVEIVDVVEYSNYGIKEFQHVPSRSLSDTASSHEEQGTCRSLSSSPKQDIPQLIRSNSYTLESPSPALAAHFEQLKGCREETKYSGQVSTVSDQTWSFLDHSVNMSEFEEIERNKRSTDVYCKGGDLMSNGCFEGKSLVGQNELKLLKLLNEVPQELANQIIGLLERKDFNKLKQMTVMDEERNEEHLSAGFPEVPAVDEYQNFSCYEFVKSDNIPSKLFAKNLETEYLIDFEKNCDSNPKTSSKEVKQVGYNRKLFIDRNSSKKSYDLKVGDYAFLVSNC